MNETSIRLIFEDITFAIEESFNDPWQPYHRNKFIPTTPASNFRNKRARAATPSKSILITNSYASMVTKGNTEKATYHRADPTIKPPPPKVHREIIEIFDTPSINMEVEQGPVEHKMSTKNNHADIDMNMIINKLLLKRLRSKIS
jgi:hypothetical protein